MSSRLQNPRVLRALRDLENMFGPREESSTEDDSIARRLSFGENILDTRTDISGIYEPKSAEAEIGALKLELLQCKAEVRRLTMERNEEEPARKMLVLSYTRELDVLQKHLQKERDLNAELKQQLIRALEQKADSRAQFSQLRQQMGNQVSQERWRHSQARCLELQQQLEERTESAQETTLALEREVMRLCTSEVMMRTSLEEAKEQVELLTSRVREKELLISHLQDETELRKAEAKAKELQRRLDDLKEVEELSRIMKEELKRLPVVEKELAKLQEEVEQHRQARMNVHLIQERLLAAQSNSAKLKKLQTLSSKQQLSLEQLRSELDQWKELAAEPHGLASPRAVLQCLADLRRSELALTERQSKLLAENETLRARAQTNSQELRRSSTKLMKLQSQFDEQTAFLRRLQKRLRLVGKEKEACRSMMESYQKEAGTDWSAAAAKQIQFLENVLTDYRHSLDQVLEEFGCSWDVTAQVQMKLDQDGALPDRKTLQEQLASAEVKNRRLMDAFRRTSQDFRQGCYTLTGYRIDVLSEGQYRLRHIYADSPDDYLLFQDAQQKMNVLETNYLHQLDGLASTYLEKYNSIPAFLGALTLKLFSQHSDLEESQL